MIVRPPASLLLAVIAAGPVCTGAARAQVTEINPMRSTLDASDPDGASGGRVNGLASVPGNNQALYAATEWGGLYKSTDAGRTWSRLDGHQPVATWDVEVDPTNPSRVYATSFYDGRVNSLSGINVSDDGGTTWTHPTTAIPPSRFCLGAARRDEPSAFGISVNPANGHVYVGTNCGLARSADSGATWAFVDPTPADPADDVWDVVVHDSGVIDTCGDDGHRRSTDGGATWVGPTGAALPSGRCSLSVSPDESYVLFAVVGTSIFESDDGGATWPTTFANPSAQGRIPFLATNQRAGGAFDLWFGDVSLWRAGCSTPVPAVGGARCPASNTWAGPYTRSAGAHDDTADILFDSQAATDACPVLMSSDGGVYYNTASTSPVCHTPTWEQPTVTPRSLWLFGMGGATQSGSANEDLYFGCQDNGTFATTNAGASPPSWTNRDCCDGFDVSADATQVLYTVCCYGGRANRLFRRNPGMTGGAEIPNYPAGNLPGWGYPDVVDRFGSDDFVVLTSTGVFVTANVGANPIVWTQLGAATTPPGACGVRAAGTTAAPTFFVQAGSCSGNQAGAVWRYTGTGSAGAWQQLTPPGNTGGYGVFTVDRSNANRLFASHLRPAGPQMIRSTDGGATWTADATLDNLMTGGGAFRYRNQRGPTDFTGFGGYAQPTLVAFDPGDTNVLVAGGADSGVFLSTNGGASWSVLTNNSGGLLNPHVPRPRFVHFEREGGQLRLYVGTQGRGVWRFVSSTLPPLCLRFPRLCGHVELFRELIEIRCTQWPCVVFDHVPRNCLLKYDCPGCEPGALCPPFYQFFLDGLDPGWGIGLVDGKGDPVEHTLVRTATGVVLSFRPAREVFVEKQIGNYFLAFQMPPGAKPGHYKVRARLKTGQAPHRDTGEVQP